ncbi:MAG: hypothetical protein HYV32_04335 [Candidatus Kerfeldbacteria bacterium]|nr:hypothetical protein [Candidatus Kerfeldbacteria bacterium]
MTKTNGARKRKQSWWRTIDPLFWPYAVIGLAAILFSMKMGLYYKQAKDLIPESSYQAVFLSNGQVYFGHLDIVSRSYLELTDVYYIKEQLPENTTEDAADTDTTDMSDQTQLSVVRLGNEVHQPVNKLTLNRDHILFWETLQPDSRIIDAINKDKNQ